MFNDSGAAPDIRLAAAALEINAQAQALDTRKAGLTNPYNRLLASLRSLRIRYGILTNGSDWLLIDNARGTPAGRSVSFCLLRIIESLTDAAVAADAAAALGKFWRLLNARTYAEREDKEKLISAVSQHAEERGRRLEADLKSVIYGDSGRYSLFENIGRAIYSFAAGNGKDTCLDGVFESSMYLLFRLVFLSYFEDRHKEALSAHPGYASISLSRTAEFMNMFPPDRWRGRYALWESLKRAFNALSGGHALTGVPALGGGLFSPEKAPLLEEAALIPDRELFLILNGLLFSAEGRLRNFGCLPPSHLGTIYQGLTEYEFRIADEDLSYLKITYVDKNRGEHVRDEGFFGSRDMARLEKLKIEAKEALSSVKQGELYLQNASRNRKISGAYYTPESLASRLAGTAIERLLETSFRDPSRSLLDVRILDNSCGSGQLLIEALNALCAKALERTDSDPLLREALESEVTSINASRRKILADEESAEESLAPDERGALKRILLKKTIFGVDQSRFAVELAKLSLWLDTFIFGTPLPFIESHIKHGNSLVGADLGSAASILEAGQVHAWKCRKRLADLQARILDKNRLADSETAQARESDNLYAEGASESVKELDMLLDAQNCRDMLEARLAMNPVPSEFSVFGGMGPASGPGPPLARVKDFLTDPGSPYARNLRLTEKLKSDFAFFNWETQFPEVFAGNDPGFHVIIGNPPWDRTQFEEPLFFSGYRKSYRTLPESEKRSVKRRILRKPEAKTRYISEKSKISVLNKYLLHKYPLSRGAGSGNLFRFFVERSLGLLAAGGSLNYVIPSALLTDDGSKALRRHILENFSIISFNGFHNLKPIFPDIHPQTRFGLIQIEKSAVRNRPIKSRFMLTDPDVLDSDDGVFLYRADDLENLSPEHLAFLEISDGPRQFPLLAKIRSSHRPLDRDWLDFSQDLHAPYDNALIAEIPCDRPVRVFEGKNIEQFHFCRRPARLRAEPAALERHLSPSCLTRLLADVRAQFGLSAPDSDDFRKSAFSRLKGSKLRDFLSQQCGTADLSSFVRPDCRSMRIFLRDVSNARNARTSIAAAAPAGTACLHSIWASIPGRYRYDDEKRSILFAEIPPERLFFALGILNSIPFDWIARFSVSTHVTKSILFRIPFPQPYDAEIMEPGPFRDLARHAALLTLRNTPDLFPGLAGRFGITEGEIAMTEKQYDAVMAGASVIAARIYGLSAGDMEIMLESFRVLKKRQPGFFAELVKQSRDLLPS
ncbi:MAG: hypothetical protein LBW85_07220 [Deltaproteobacteria bacterium]|nr:hypothetical protein [Deltaproteobacteria bacterium]